ncbi:HAD-IA family hydrolase [Streptomyces cyaneofuscatus]|uniref:HAD-IA family hydrolase n=1 Tax=Streptomyces cyaneofuscatus TaxID=66883 RepID=UPI0034324082
MTAACVILDIGGVLEFTPDTGWVQRWEKELELAPGAVDERMRDVWEAGSVGSIGEQEVREQVAARLELDAGRLEAFMGDLWAEYLGTPNEELIAYLRGLRGLRGLRELRGSCALGILSNSFVGARERETALYRFDELVDDIVYSHEIGINKPDPRAFEAACAGLGVRPEDCLFVDDVLVNVEAARAVGMQAHLYEDNARTIARIAAHVVEAGRAPRT